MPGKFSKYRNDLQRRPVESYEFGERILLRKAELSSLSKQELAETIKSLKNRKKAITKELSGINLDLISAVKLLVEHLESSGEESFKLSSGGSFFIQDKPYPNIINKELFRHWCIDNGYESSMSLHYKTVDAIAVECVESGKPLPDGMELFIDVGIGTRNVLEKEENDE